MTAAPRERCAPAKRSGHPAHASWLNQAEIYFSVVQRKAIIPNDFPDLDCLAHTLDLPGAQAA